MNYGYGTMCGKSWKKRVSEMKRRKLENYIFGGCIKQTMGCMRWVIINCPWHDDGTKEVATLDHFHNMRVIYGTTYLFGILCIAAHMLGRITTLFRNFRFLVENFGPWNLPWEEFFVWMSKSKLLLHKRVELN